MKPKTATSLIRNVLEWIFTLVEIVLFVRLILLLVNVVFNFSQTRIGRLINEGAFFERLTDISPYNIAIQIAIIVVAVIMLSNLKKSKSNTGETETSEDNEHS